MKLNNRFEMLMYLNVILKKKKDREYLQDTVGQLIRYVNDPDTTYEYDYVMRILKNHSNLNEEYFEYVRDMLHWTRRSKINSCFEMGGFDFLTSELYQKNYDTGKYTDEAKYVALMYGMFGFDFSVNSVELCFLNNYKDYLVPDCLFLHSYKEHIMWKECNPDWEDDDKMMIIANYEDENFIFVRDDNVYIMAQGEEHDPECWKYICKVSEVKKNLHKTKEHSFKLLSIND